MSDSVVAVEPQAGDCRVTMSNALTRAGHGLTLAGKHLLMPAVFKLDSMEIMRLGERLPSVKITATARAFYGRSITFFEPDFRRNGEALKPFAMICDGLAAADI